ncbi:hypothetical protein [Streptomyces sp. NPDC059176]|uniref:hypothetical protein n=1 Tax=unclassified Streptomyces TaxID=2593676 RepID=UPI0036AAABC6
MSGPSRRTWRLAGSLLAWWLPLALGLWLVGRATGQPASAASCAASAALLAAIGETGDWVRRRWRARHPAAGRRSAAAVEPPRR